MSIPPAIEHPRRQATIQRIFTEELEPFSDIAPDNELRIHMMPSGDNLIGWHHSQAASRIQEMKSDIYTYVDCQIQDDIFYLISIWLAAEHRGKGIGDRLYKAMERIAERLECKKINQTPSGTTSTGESRRLYLMRRGWQIEMPQGLAVYKDIPYATKIDDMTKGQLEERLKELLSVRGALLFYADGQFTLSSPVDRIACSGSGSTIQQALFQYDFNRKKLP